jgi:hypothetical protein
VGAVILISPSPLPRENLMTIYIPMVLLPAIQQVPVWAHESAPKRNNPDHLANDFRKAINAYESSKYAGAMIRIGHNGTKFYWVRARKILTRYPFESAGVSTDPAQHSDQNPRFVHSAEVCFVASRKR